MATNGSNARWVPPPGRHKVDVGGSLKRALRARKGTPAPTNKMMPVSDYYLFKCECCPSFSLSPLPAPCPLLLAVAQVLVLVHRAWGAWLWILRWQFRC